ncbi:hypothetical protein JHJ32_07435 [Parapedobacter sp. ISTM3]|uniref:hypothetical protein n=1 Tax=Parapedobacter sp. ISTM3 TaxID=2800130 RepID=UPI001904609A|nr:hypothetical protein [Parapedobacter sp. ISTM3]MBK1439810.1 hypothetical protein [Parapedobacter sp. ISTM3]
MKRLLFFAFCIVLLANSCRKAENPLEENPIEGYVGLFDKGYIASVPVDTINIDRGKAMVDSLARHIFIENEISGESELSIFHFGGSAFGFFSVITPEEAKRLETDSRIREISENSIVTAAD